MGTIREAMKSDLERIAQINNYYIENTTVHWAWYPQSKEETLKWFGGHGWPGRPILVYEQDGEILGYGALSDYRSRDGYWPVAEDSVYVAPEHTGKGIGGQLLKELLKRAKNAGLKAVIGVIDSENTGSIALHEKEGFLKAGELKDIGDKFGKALGCVILIKHL